MTPDNARTPEYVDPFAVEGVDAPAAQGGAAGAEPDADWQPL